MYRDFVHILPSCLPWLPVFRPPPRDMDCWTHVFVRNDVVHGPLNSPYLGPFKVLSRARKYFKLDMKVFLF